MSRDAASLAARSDQTKLCARCVARFGGSTCPGCGHAPAFDLSRAEDRRQAIEWVAERFPGRSLRPFLQPFRASRLPALALAATAGAVALMGAIAQVWMAAAAAAAAGIVVLSRLVTRGAAKSSSPSELHAIGVLSPELPADSGDRVLRRGNVDTQAPLVAPLSGEACVAFRIVGRVGDCLVDDAAAAPFSLAPRDGPSVTVLSSACLLELPVHSVTAERGALQRVQRFLAERGVDASVDPIELAEGVIRAGDEVAVSGLLESVSSGAGYRASAQSELLVGHTDSPVVVRRA